MDKLDALDALIRKPKQHNWSTQQAAIFAEDPEQMLIVEAVAGSGKSTTIVEKMKRNGGDSLFLAFNKSIADELRSKVSGSAVITFNALGNRILLAKRPGAKFNQWKTHNYLKQHMSGDSYEVIGKHVARVVSVAKGSAFGIFEEPTSQDFRALADAYCQELLPDQIEPVVTIAKRAFSDVLAKQDEYDFDDQLYVPVLEGWTFPRHDYVFPDEAQDLNPIQHCMLNRLAERGAIITAVGDRRQAIYGFRGALSNSMDLLAQTFFMKELPLSVTYRCSLAVTELAQTIVPQIQPRDGAPQGAVNHLAEYPDLSAYADGDLVLCRNNAPIFSLALQFLRARRPCRVMSNFLDELEKFMSSFKARDVATLSSRLEGWFQKNKQDCEDRGAWGKLEGITDKYETLRSFTQEFATIPELSRAIRDLSTSLRGPRISTIHKAKGLEADNVYLLRWDLLPSPRAVTKEQITQEENLRYVAITRARNNLNVLPAE